jgi:hypothetical protein
VSPVCEKRRPMVMGAEDEDMRMTSVIQGSTRLGL